MAVVLHPWQILVATLAGWITRQQDAGSEYLREIVHHMWNAERDVSLVPIAVFRGRGMRRKDARMQMVVK